MFTVTHGARGKRLLGYKIERKREMSGSKNKEIWIKADDDVGTWEEKKARITTGLESGVDCVLVERADVDKVRELGRIKIAVGLAEGAEADDDDVVVYGKRSEGDGTEPIPAELSESKVLAALKQEGALGRSISTAAYIEIRGKEYERFAVNLADYCDYVIVIGKDWKIIPLENIIAELQKKEVKVIAGVKSAEEMRTALETLEYGADGVLIDSLDPSEIKRAVGVREESETSKIMLSTARITAVTSVEMGDRVCVDTCSLMKRGEGMLVGSQSFALFLVHSESEESPYVDARPFRVNAGAVHSYILVGEKTKYLADLKSGDEVLVVSSEGNVKKAVVGRAKIEKRPLMLVEAEVEVGMEREGKRETTRKKCSVILQNAETIKLVGKEKKPISVVELNEGDEVLVHVTEAARHFGMAVEEMVIEK
jgi:3-dehydroquinate synthase II